MKATHKLLQEFKFRDGETYHKGALVRMSPPHRKHFGFCCSVAMLDRRGRIRACKDGAFAVFSKDHFKPLKVWFERIEA